jgi:hypothetical protein
MFYETGKACKYGHISKRYLSTRQCAECVSQRYSSDKEVKKELARNYHHAGGGKALRQARDAASLPELAKKKRDYRALNPDKVRATKNEWAKRNPESVAATHKRWRRSDAGKASRRASSARLRSTRPWIAASRGVISSLIARVGRRPNGRGRDHVRYTHEQFKQRIELNFKPGMSWENHGEWHIDHIKPVIAFIRQGVTDTAVINSLCNLRPEWAKDNLRKNATWR